ncbi:MAG: hypothetical protein AB4060_22410 [Crocosphaera sp.]
MAYYSNRLSYQEVENLVERVTGQRILSDQKIWEIVINQAGEISAQWQEQINKINSLMTKEIEISPTVDIYNSEQEEILLFDDGIGVKKQKDNRERNHSPTSERAPLKETEISEVKKSRKNIITDLVLLETAKGRFEYITSPINREGQSVFPLEKMIAAKLKAYYHNYNHPLPIVAITDGASNIRRRLNQLNPQGITIILDWYHLGKKIREFLSMIARNKSEKTDHSKFLFFHLWHGKLEEVLTYLTTKIKARNPEKLNELITYFNKHQSEIINYARRSQAGKTIGSGRMEKGVDLVIGHRQKHKGMSWRALGSRALAILKVAELNGHWQQIWLTQTA